MRKQRRAVQSVAAAVAALVCVSSGPVQATEGYFQHGYGARHKALAGAGAADSRDATAISLNPAGLTHVQDQTNAALSVFSPRRELEGSGQPGLTPLGEVDSGREYFLIPNLAHSHRIGDNTVFAVGIYGNGGMNTHFPEVARPDGGCAPAVAGGLPGVGVFCAGGVTGVDLTQIFLSGALAHKFGRVSVGIAPILAIQLFEAEGVRSFGPLSSNPALVSNQGTNVSAGGGVRAGVEVQITDRVRAGVAGNSRIYMQEFSSYSGLFAERGDFDIPPSLTAGVAFDVNPKLTVMFDYKRIWYSLVDSIGSPSALILGALAGNPNNLLGGSAGAGFGWDDINILKFGVEWRKNDKWTLRAGYAYNENPIGPEDVMFNILAPGVVKHHITGGFKYAWNDRIDFEFAAFYAPHESVTGSELPLVGNPNHTIEIGMHQYEVTAGVSFKLYQTEPPLK